MSQATLNQQGITLAADPALYDSFRESLAREIVRQATMAEDCVLPTSTRS